MATAFTHPVRSPAPPDSRVSRIPKIAARSPRVLVTDGGYKHTLGAVRHLARAGFVVDVVGAPGCLASWSRYLNRVVCDDETFTSRLDDFIGILQDQQYDVLLPISAKAVSQVASHRAEIEQHCRVPVAERMQVEFCFDKARVADFAPRQRVRSPKTWHPSSQQALEDLIGDVCYPVVVKGVSELDKFPPIYAATSEELRDGVRHWLEASVNAQRLPIIQQRIKGPGEGFFALYDHGTCKRVFMHRRIRETPPSGGASCCAVSIFAEDLMQAGRRLLDALEWHGVAMAEFKRDAKTGELYLLEINPKFWGSLDLALAAGVNFPALATRMAMGEALSFSQDYRVGLKYHWPLNGEIAHVVAAPRKIPAVLMDCLNPAVRSNVMLRDPMPSLYSIGTIVRRAARVITRRTSARGDG